MKKIRCIAIAWIRHKDQTFVLEGFDPIKHDYFYRPIGGGIDFGETGFETVQREFQEETQLALKNVNYLTTLENIFTYKGQPGHEIVRLYQADFVEDWIYQTPEITAFEDSGKAFRACWVDLADFESGKKRLVPEDLLGFINAKTSPSN